MGWSEMEWDGMEWNGVGWDGVVWDGMGWSGVGWDGAGWDGLEWDKSRGPLKVLVPCKHRELSPPQNLEASAARRRQLSRSWRCC